jgi:hypothetical protein
MAATQHGLANGHEVCHRVFSIANELCARSDMGRNGGRDRKCTS